MRRAVLAALLSLTVLGVAVAGPAPALPASAAVPAGFTDTLVRGGYGVLTAIQPLPDGRLLVLAQAGSMYIVDPVSGSSTLALSLPVCSNSERGLLGVALDPSFVTSGALFVYATRNVGGVCKNQVLLFGMSGNVVSGPFAVLVDDIASAGGNHNGGDLEVGADGYLYVAVGDSGTDPRGNSGSAGNNDAAQDLSLLNGKILRVTTSGGTPPTNPLVGAPGGRSCRFGGPAGNPIGSVCSEIFAAGLRNPYRFAFDPNTGATRFRINDVGQNTWEEVDEGQAGANYGWNVNEGPCRTGTNCTTAEPGFVGPVAWYPHALNGLDCDYITGGAFVPDGRWPAAYDGGYLFADGGCGRIWLDPAGATGTNFDQPLATGVDGLTDMAFGAGSGDPSLYYVTQFGEVRRIRYDAPAPAATGPLAFTPTQPTRVYDSRTGVGGDEPGFLRAGTSRLVDVPGAGGSVRAVLANLTLDGSAGPTVIQAWPARTEKPGTSILNASQAGEIVANSVVLPVDANGDLLVSTSTTTHLVIDVLGTFSDAPGAVAAGRFTPVLPARLVDTRQPSGPTNSYSRSGSGRASLVDLDVGGLQNVPADAAAAALLVTAVADGSAGPGFVTVYSGPSRPLASNVNTSSWFDIRTNLVVVPLDAGGNVRAYLENVGNIVVDVVGWYTGPSAAPSGAGRFVVTPPTRVVDTRSGLGFGRLADNATSSTNPVVVPDTALAVVQNLTVTETSREGFLTALPQGGTRNLVSNLVYLAPNQTRAAGAITQLGAGGGASYYAQRATHLVVDVSGYVTAS